MARKTMIMALLVLALMLTVICTGAMWIEEKDTMLSNIILGASLIGLLCLIVAINKEAA